MRLSPLRIRLLLFWLVALVALVGPWYVRRLQERSPETPSAVSATVLAPAGSAGTAMPPVSSKPPQQWEGDLP